MASILIVDDDLHLRQSFDKLLTQEGHAVKTASSGEAALPLVRSVALDLAIMDVRLPGMNGLETFKAVRKLEPLLPVIMMTAFGTTETAIEATKMGAFDYILKPFNIPEMLVLIEQAVEAGRFMRSRIELDVIPETDSSEAIIGRSRPMQEVYKAIGRVAFTEATVLIRGESGTGKELVARALYQHSARADKPFLIINCVAIPETLLESELFGYEKGAFTGAVNRRVGRIEQANGGTVFLDEIGDMPSAIQAKILRLLQEKSIERLGGREPIPVDVRIIAATNRNLEAALVEGKFREDLYYRLKVVTIELPPLREREGDIALLCEYFTRRYAKKMAAPNPGIATEALRMLSSYSWPGNVRELSNTIHKALIFNRGAPVSRDDIARASGIPETERAEKSERPPEEAIRAWVRGFLAAEADVNPFDSAVDQISAMLITEALNIAGGNRTRAAKLLGLSRPTLIAKIEKYRIRFETSATTED
ncbi:MAG: sigma-54 dependent transcriptional regulator [Desulfobacteraceae bacterium]|nr:sigma-54 dependent transcriptional regulator [Desulfobacteraceae bacterium]